ncbi:MAG: SDR family oxidoreductase [Pusillimonas sp.]|nr:SDR family oxidoreductase [Pusillimonas sp.]
MSISSRIFVVGASGYIGKNLFERANTITTTFGTSSSGGQGLLRLRLDEPDDFNYQQINEGDSVILTAAISSPDTCLREHDYAWSVNVTGTSRLISNVIKQGGRVVFFSSDTVYGESKNEVDEKGPNKPAGEYAAMKHEVEQRFIGHPSFKTIRLSYVFSREDKFTRYLNTCINQSRPAELFHPFFRAIVHRDDVTAGTLALVESWKDIPDAIINFGGPDVLSRLDFATHLQRTIWPHLQFSVSEPSTEFFQSRPRIIAMKSPIFAKLLGRSPRQLNDAIRIEFAL